MNPFPSQHRGAHVLRQVFLIDRNPGLLCRILGLYAARGIDVGAVDYDRAAQEVMRLRVSVEDDNAASAELVRVLVDKASTFVGVLAACEEERVQRRAA